MSNIKKVKLGSQGFEIPIIGLGCMGMTGIAGYGDVYGKADEKEAIATIHRSFELGGNFLDTADMYGPLLNERLVAKAIVGNRDQYIIATKFGNEVNDEGMMTGKINGAKDYVRKSVERSLKNLGTDYIASNGIEVIVPKDHAIIEELHRIIHEELTYGTVVDSSKKYFLEVIENMIADGAQGIILGCTEFPLMIFPEDLEIPVFNTTLIHSEAAVAYILGK